MPRTTKERSTEVCDVFVRRGNARRYYIAAEGIPISAAYQLVDDFRADPTVNWAYCSEPRVEREKCPDA